MHGSNAEILRDYADESHPRTLCTFRWPVFSILDPHHVVALDDSGSSTATAIIELPSARVFDLGVAGNVDAIAPDFSQVLWYSTGNPPVLQDTWKTGSTTIQVYPELSGLCGIEPVAGAFSRDARYGFAVWLQGAAYLNIVDASTHQGVLAIKPPASGQWPPFQGPEMPLWDPVSDQLFWTQGGVIKTWTPSDGTSTLRTGLTWSWPTMSPDGTHLAYILSDSSGNGTVWLLNPQTGASQGKIGTGTQAMFLTKDWIWVKNNTGGCGPQSPATYIYDLRDHTTTASSLDWVYATWPATSALGG